MTTFREYQEWAAMEPPPPHSFIGTSMDHEVTPVKPGKTHGRSPAIDYIAVGNNACAWPKPSIRTNGFPHRADPVWDTALTTKFPQPIAGEGELLTPYGTSKPLGVLGTFYDRATELNALMGTQFQELPTLAAEFAANGLTAISLSSSSEDDDMDAANIAESHLRRTPYTMDPVTVAPLLRRIEWEKYIFACGPNTFVAAIQDKNNPGKMVINTTDKKMSVERLATYVPKMKEMIGERTYEELENDRIRSWYYGKELVWSLMTPDERDAWKRKNPGTLMYLRSASHIFHDAWWAEDHEEKRATQQGPVELGLHNLGSDAPDLPWFPDPYEVLSEPTPFELWGEKEDDITGSEFVDQFEF
jgi:hypothetical protein